MATVTIEIPDELAEQFKSIDEIRRTVYEDFIIEQRQREGMSLEQFIMLAMAEKASAIATETYLEERAKRGSREKFLTAMARVADVEPPDEQDRM